MPACPSAPSDILLSNCRQLDHLLIQPDGTSVLRHLVVDALHSFDGAQVATLGEPESRGAMRDDAGPVFARRFEPEALIEEEMLSPEEFFAVPTAFGEEGLFALPPAPSPPQSRSPAPAGERPCRGRSPATR